MNPWKMKNQLFLAEGAYPDVHWQPATVDPDSPLARVECSRGVAFADADNDGDIDLFIVDLDRGPQLLENRSERSGRWLLTNGVPLALIVLGALIPVGRLLFGAPVRS